METDVNIDRDIINGSTNDNRDNSNILINDKDDLSVVNSDMNNTELARIETELEFMHEENDRMKTEHENERAHFVDKINRRRTKIKDLEARLNIMKNEYTLNLKHLDDKLNSASDALNEKDVELKELRILAKDLKKQNEKLEGESREKDSMIEEIKSKISEEVTRNKCLSDKLIDKTEIAKNIELAFNLQKDLIAALKSPIQSSSIDEPETNADVTSNKNNDGGHENALAEGKTFPSSVNDSIDFLQIHGKNGVGFNSILLWVDIQRQIHPADVWIPAALKGFTPEEITDAKNSLWRINNGRNLPKLISRQGGSKSLNKLKDICLDFNSLSESNEIPIFICTSNMVAQTPIFSSNDTISDDDRLKAIETSLANVLHQLNSSSFKNRFDDTKVINSSYTDEIQSEEELQDNPILENTEVTDIMIDCTPVSETNNQPLKIDEKTEFSEGNVSKDTKNELNTLSPNADNKNVDCSDNWQQVKPKRKKVSILSSSPKDVNLVADISIVISGVSKSIGESGIKRYMEKKGIIPKKCELLTRNGNSYSHTYKISINTVDLRKAKNPSFWPVGIEVKLFNSDTNRFSPRNHIATQKSRKKNFKNQAYIKRTNELAGKKHFNRNYIVYPYNTHGYATGQQWNNSVPYFRRNNNSDLNFEYPDQQSFQSPPSFAEVVANDSNYLNTKNAPPKIPFGQRVSFARDTAVNQHNMFGLHQ